MEDPFAQPTPAETYTTTTTKENRMTDDQNNAKVTATLKGGSGFDAPWIVIHGNTPAEVLSILEDTETKALLEQTQKVGQFFAGMAKPSAAPAQASRGGGAPAGAQAPPAGAPESPGPGWVFKSGVSKAGKPWKAWMPPQGSDEKPLFFN